jgi:XTP/dITP diphosphohydrolase
LSAFPNAPNIKETGRTYLDNATKKAVNWARHTGQIVLAEDSGIEIKALNWEPGIHSARYASTNKHRNATDAENRAKLLAALKGLPRSKRIARYRCVAVLAHPDKGVLAKSHGTCYGYIADKACGKNGFGYDPVFIPKVISSPLLFPLPSGERIKVRGQTFGQLPAYIKNRLSHRAKAIRGIIPLLAGLSADLQQIHKILDTDSKSP